MNQNREVVFLLNMTLDEGNSAPSVHLMTGIIAAAAERVDTIHLITRQYAANDCAELCAVKSSCNVVHEMIDVKPAGRANIAKRYLNDAWYFKKAGAYMRGLRGAQDVFVQSCVNPAAAISFTKKALPHARVTYNVQDIYSEAAVCRKLVRRNDPVYSVFSAFETYAYKHSDCIITVSEGMAQTIRECGGDPSRVFVIHNWTYNDVPIDIAKADNQFMQKNGLDTSTFKVVYAGNIGALQDVETLVDAASLLNGNESIEFVIVGDGVRADAIRKTVSDRGLTNVRLFGRQPSEIVEQVYSLADLNVITLMPGMTRAALPSKTAICLSCGRPILLSSDLGSTYVERMLQTNNCVACEPRNARELADAILRAYDMRESFDSNGSRGLFHELFNGSKNKSAYCDLILGE